MSLIEIDWNPDQTKLRQFALIWFCGFLLVGLLFAWRLGCLTGSQNWSTPLLIWTIAAAVGLPGLVFPLVVRPVYKLWMAIAFPVGCLLSYTMLAIIYFGVFTLLSLVFRLMGRDPLDRHGTRKTDSYWIKRPAKTSAQRYFQQF